jgi:hypothetical protein
MGIIQFRGSVARRWKLGLVGFVAWAKDILLLGPLERRFSSDRTQRLSCGA